MNITTMALFGIIVIMIFAIVSNTSTTGLSNIDVQFLRITCPLPINAGVASNLTITGSTLSYDVTYDTSGGDYHVTTFHCGDGNVMGASTTVYTTANNWFNVGLGYLFYISEVISKLFQSLIGLMTLLSYILTPINFNILGYTIADVSGIALMVIIGIYIICYIFIGIFIYKAVMPSGGG
jgi:hypothetical protein